jgi:GcrA cell cycle regulator
MSFGFWSSDKEAFVRAKWVLGWTALQISELIGCSRNAVIGKVSRMRLTRPRVLNNKPPKLVKPKEPEPPPLEEPTSRVSWDDITSNDCKWPLGDPLTDNFAFCGQPSDKKHPYCAYHSKIAFQEPKK